METLIVQPYDWEALEDKGTILAWCLDRGSKNYLLRFEGLPFFGCYVELPSKTEDDIPITWHTFNVNRIKEWFSRALDDDSPEHILYEERDKLYYYNPTKIKTSMLYLGFFRKKALQHCVNLLKRIARIPSIGSLYLKVWEEEINPVRRLLTETGCGYAQWFSIEGRAITERDRISMLEREYIVEAGSLKPLKDNWTTQPTLLAFDIEVYSHNHLAFPDRLAAQDEVYMISCIYQRVADPSSRKRYGIIIGDVILEGEGEFAEIIRVSDLKELVHQFGVLINRLDPDIISGYNILGFDYERLDIRLKRKKLTWPCLGRLKDVPTVLHSKTWRSSAFGVNEVNLLYMPGRISIDMLPLIKREYKLDKYDLDFVSKQFLPGTKGKHDIKAREMFEIYDRLCQGVPGAKEEMGRVMAYCLQDAELVIELFEKLRTWISLVEMSNVMGVTLMELFTHGQQIRCVSMMYDLAHRKGFVLNRREMEKVKFKGAYVFTPIPGLYRNAICLDFASLYPSIIRAYNICFTTLVAPEDENKIPDEMCNIIEFDQEEEDYKKEGAEEEEEEESEGEDIAAIRIKHYRYKFVKAEIRVGLLPQLVEKLVNERKEVRKYLEGIKDKKTGEWIIKKEEDPIQRIILDKRQLSLKVGANSLFGFLGAQGGKLPLIEGARCITACGRMLINRVNEYLKEKYKAKLIYGDSVTKDTPLLIKKEDGTACYIEIESLVQLGKMKLRWDEKGEVDLSQARLKVWSDRGWTLIKRVIRHYTNKEIYRIKTPRGEVEVTADHSLLDPEGNPVKPEQLQIGDYLLHHPLPNQEALIISSSNYHGNKIMYAYKYYDDSPLKKEDTAITSIVSLGSCNDYVYDIETENHHFSAGIGCIVVHNTDSSMADLNIEDPKEAVKMGIRLSQEISGVKKGQELWDGSEATQDIPGLFPPPLAMEFEKAMDILCIKKKKYAALLINKDGSYKKNKEGTDYEVLKRGIVLARRDNCEFLRRVYNDILLLILKRKSAIIAMNCLVDALVDLLEGKVDCKHLAIVRGVGIYKPDTTYFMKTFADELEKIGRPVQPGDRIEYLIVDVPGETKIGKKMRSLEWYLEKPEPIDYGYYIEKQLKNPIDQLMAIGYMKTFEAIDNKYKEPRIGYKPQGRFHFIPISEPVKMFLRMIKDGRDIRLFKKIFEVIVNSVDS